MNYIKNRRSPSEINAGSMADIAFLLLIFFLVTTTIMEDKGIRVKLPIWKKTPLETPVNTNNILTVKLNSENALMVEGNLMALDELKDETKAFISNPLGLPNRPSNPKKSVVSLQNDRGTEYEAYLEVYDQLIAAYRELREESAQLTFGQPYELLSKAKQKEIKKKIPMVISEAEPTDMAFVISGKD